jgi:hypothetical protein
VIYHINILSGNFPYFLTKESKIKSVKRITAIENHNKVFGYYYSQNFAASNSLEKYS